MGRGCGRGGGGGGLKLADGHLRVLEGRALADLGVAAYDAVGHGHLFGFGFGFGFGLGLGFV